MRASPRKLFILGAVLALVLVALPAGAGHNNDTNSQNLHGMGHIEEPASLLLGPPTIHTDIAFQGRYAFQGNWLGFNIRDISDKSNPVAVSFTSCEGNQGDVVVYRSILVRSWNSPAAGGEDCDGSVVPAGFEGIHIFDIRNVNDPVLVGSVDLSDGAVPGRCGAHTITGIPDPANNRLIVYANGSGGCNGFDVVEIPLRDPGAATYLRTEDPGRGCHDVGVILGNKMMAACAGGDGWSLMTLDGTGSLTDPDLLMSVSVPNVGIGHSAAFSNDGGVLIFGHEPGGGVQASCQSTSPVEDKSLFFFDTSTGDLLGTWVLPRDQRAIENCTMHNYNVVPLQNGNNLLVIGNYQAGTSVVDFNDPANPFEVAYSDPRPIPPPGGPFCGGLGCEIGGVWSSYWYNNFIYETNITEGLNIFRLRGDSARTAKTLGHLNPQTQEFTVD